jgi:pyridoxine 5'-phosphate synthase PdxJ
VCINFIDLALDNLEPSLLLQQDKKRKVTFSMDTSVTEIKSAREVEAPTVELFVERFITTRRVKCTNASCQQNFYN